MTDAAASPMDYEAFLQQARAAAARKRLSGEVPEGTGAALDRLFVEVAPAGARAGGQGLEAVLEMLGRYRFDPSVSVGAAPGVRGRAAGMLKRALQPVTSWQLRHLTDQLNAYHQAEIDLLRALVEQATSSSPQVQAGPAPGVAPDPPSGPPAGPSRAVTGSPQLPGAPPEPSTR